MAKIFIFCFLYGIHAANGENMYIKIHSVADRIRSGFINKIRLRNIQKFAQSEDMLLHSIPLRDGSVANILANAIEYDCIIMKDGKFLTARGQAGTTEDVATGIMGLFEHIGKRGRAKQGVNVDLQSFMILDDYLKKFGKLMPD